MKSISSIIIPLAILVIIVAGCSIRNNKQESQEPKTEKKSGVSWLLAGDVSKVWAIESFTVDGIDQLKGLETCQLDNLDVYCRNLVYESIEGNTRCKTNDPEIRRHGKWSLNADSTAIEVKLGTDLFSLQIIEISEKKLHYRSNDNNHVTEAVLVASDYKFETIIQADTIH
ncbi:MAG: hypothetical protein FD166_1946 [Bacteroidetes bacterium]|nr:MAG: hypothetical protein FD166_1946 [Bacteroidota bacterium]